MLVRGSTYSAGPGTAQVLAEDAGLRDAVAPDERAAALAASAATVLELRAGTWDAAEAVAAIQSGYGLLVLAGLLIRRVGAGGRYGAELLTHGDVLRPWQHDGATSVMCFETGWRVIGGARLAVLDLGWAVRMAPYAQVGCELVGRATARSLRAATLMAIVQQPRLDDRIRMLFWDLADRHGVVRPDGIHVDIPLTHEVLSHLAAARRPSVSSSLSRLAHEGVLRREGRAWVLMGDPPETR